MALFEKKTKERVLRKLTAKESPLAMRLLARPRVTEKAYAMNTLNKYVFEVTKTSTKKSVKRAVEEAYGVNVLSVNMTRLPAKKHLSGRKRTPSFKGAVKKAVVTVVEGQTIELFKAGM